jgi:SAM-dependent methyltransferase
VFPGGPELAVELVKPFNLAKKKTMLDLGCGLGGGTRAIAKATRAAVRGLELSATLAAAGMAASQKAGMAKKAPIAAWDPAGGKLPDAPVDAVFARQLLGRVDDKPGVVAALAKALKPGGQIMFVELAFPRPDAASPALDAWRAVEDEAPHPPLLEDVANGLIAQGIDVRLAEDMSPAFHARVRRAWAGVAKALPAAGLDPEERRLLLREVELWTCRLAACEAGDLRIARVHGQRKA